MNSSTKHSAIGRIVSSSLNSATPFSSSGSSKSNSSLGMFLRLQVPSSKNQRSSISQFPKVSWPLEVWRLVFHWNLEVGAWCFHCLLVTLRRPTAAGEPAVQIFLHHVILSVG